MINRFEKFTFTLSALSRCIHKICSEEMEKYGLRGLYVPYLVTMRRFPNGITAAELCEICDKNKAAVSRAISEMESRGLLEPRREAGGLYRAKLKLTAKGKQAANFVCRKVDQAVDIAGAGLSDEHRKIFYDALNLIASNLQTLSEEGLPSHADFSSDKPEDQL